MNDLISRQAAIDALGEEPEVWDDDDEYGMGQRSEWCYIKKTIEKLPSAQPERKIGEWIKVDPHIVICPFCKKASSPKNFCADCGADLRGGNNE